MKLSQLFETATPSKVFVINGVQVGHSEVLFAPNGDQRSAWLSHIAYLDKDDREAPNKTPWRLWTAKNTKTDFVYKTRKEAMAAAQTEFRARIAQLEEIDQAVSQLSAKIGFSFHTVYSFLNGAKHLPDVKKMMDKVDTSAQDFKSISAKLRKTKQAR